MIILDQRIDFPDFRHKKDLPISLRSGRSFFGDIDMESGDTLHEVRSGVFCKLKNLMQ